MVTLQSAWHLAVFSWGFSKLSEHQRLKKVVAHELSSKPNLDVTRVFCTQKINREGLRGQLLDCRMPELFAGISIRRAPTPICSSEFLLTVVLGIPTKQQFAAATGAL